MRGWDDPAWKRYYGAVGRAAILLNEGQISGNCYRVIHEQARRRAYREQTPRRAR